MHLWQGFYDVFCMVDFVFDSLIVHELFELLERDYRNLQIGEKSFDQV